MNDTFLDNLFVLLVYMLPVLLLFILGGIYDMFSQINQALKQQKRINELKRNGFIKITRGK